MANVESISDKRTGTPAVNAGAKTATAGGPHFDAATRQDALLCAVNLQKSYYTAKLEIPVLRRVNLEVRQGEFISIGGQSGSGKSTLLHVLATLDRPDGGEVWFNGQRVDNRPAHRRDAFRNHDVGMIFQFYHLLPELSALENVLAPTMISYGAMRYWFGRRQHMARAKELLELVGLGHRLKHKPRELSGGEMQRAAIARALVNRPQVLLADEPTGNLDNQTGGEIMQILRTLNRDQKLTIVMVTHDASVAALANRSVRMVEGRLRAA